MKSVGALGHHDARIVAEFPREFAVGGIDAVNFCSAGLKKTISEATGGAAEIRAHQSSRVDGELSEGVMEFEPAARDELGRGWIHR